MKMVEALVLDFVADTQRYVCNRIRWWDYFEAENIAREQKKNGAEFYTWQLSNGL